MMIRLYCDQAFIPGKSIELAEEELRYFRKIRRGQGEVCLFNQKGQIARGRIEKSYFKIEQVENSKVPSYNLTMAVGIPEPTVIPMLVRSLSELGVDSLILFPADRSQTSAARLSNLKRYEKISIEAARQCGRGIPLHLFIEKEIPLEKFSDAEKLFFTEAEENFSENAFPLTSIESQPKLSKVLAIVGPEGGWSERERRLAVEKNFRQVHFSTPILKVHTAAVCGAFFAIERMQPTDEALRQ